MVMTLTGNCCVSLLNRKPIRNPMMIEVEQKELNT